MVITQGESGVTAHLTASDETAVFLCRCCSLAEPTSSALLARGVASSALRQRMQACFCSAVLPSACPPSPPALGRAALWPHRLWPACALMACSQDTNAETNRADAMSRALKELRGLVPFSWDARVEEHPAGEAAVHH